MFDFRKQSVFEYNSGKLGSTVVLMAGVHGNEHSGIFALQHLIREGISLKKGKLIVVFANLDALEKNVRFVDINMNRYFGKNGGNTKEGRRIQEILPYLYNADILLDLHNTTHSISSTFLISEHPQFNDLFDCPYIVSGLDILHPGGSDGYMNSIGKIGLCLECGSVGDDTQKTTQFAYDMIINVLRFLGMVKGEPLIYNMKKSIIETDYIYFSETNNFRLSKSFVDFEYCIEGQIIGYDDQKAIYAPYDGYILFAHDRDKKGTECFVYGK